MRFGLVIDAFDASDPLDALIRQAVAAEEAGFDAVWLPGSTDLLPSPAVAAAALAPHTSYIRVGVELTAGTHPIYLAEEAAVADLCLGGRLVVAIRSDDAGLLAETTDVVLAAIAARPFRHEGQRWRIPANLVENEVNRADRVRVTPASAQLELPVWLTGSAAADVARERCLTFVGSVDDTAPVMAERWQQAEVRLALAVRRLRRVAFRILQTDATGSFNDDAVVAQLRDDQQAWGMDVVLVRLPAEVGLAARLRTVGELATKVVPRVQLDRLPPGLEEYWKRRQEVTT